MHAGAKWKGFTHSCIDRYGMDGGGPEKGLCTRYGKNGTSLRENMDFDRELLRIVRYSTRNFRESASLFWQVRICVTRKSIVFLKILATPLLWIESILEECGWLHF